MLSRSSEYAIRALVHMAQRGDGQSISRDSIAEATGVPSKYLSKILSDLVRTGILDSSRGPGGGFWLTRSAGRVKLADAIAPFEPVPSRDCPFGNGECSDKSPCGAHHRWKLVVDAEQDFLRRTSLLDLARAEAERDHKTQAGRRSRPRRNRPRRK